MGKHAAALTKKTIEMAMLELKLTIELMATGDEDATEHLDEAKKLIDRAKELLS